MAFAPGLTRETCPHQEQLHSHINAKIGNVRNKNKNKNRQGTCGQEPTLRTMLNKISDEVIAVNELLNKWDSEIEYQEQTPFTQGTL